MGHRKIEAGRGRHADLGKSGQRTVVCRQNAVLAAEAAACVDALEGNVYAGHAGLVMVSVCSSEHGAA